MCALPGQRHIEPFRRGGELLHGARWQGDATLGAFDLDPVFEFAGDEDLANLIHLGERLDPFHYGVDVGSELLDTCEAGDVDGDHNAVLVMHIRIWLTLEDGRQKRIPSEQACKAFEQHGEAGPFGAANGYMG